MWKPNNLKEAYFKCCTNCKYFLFLNLDGNVCANPKNYEGNDGPYFWHPVKWHMVCDNWEEVIPKSPNFWLKS